jgi:recombination protein RecA
VETAIADLKKRFGEGVLMRLSDAPRRDIGAISTGSVSLDRAIGIGGVPRRLTTEIFGPPGGGKTTILQHIMANAQAAGGIAAYIDMEHKMDPAYAAICGVVVDDLIISQPPTGAAALDIAAGLLASKGIDIVAVDSVAALSTPAEADSDAGDHHMAAQARMLSQWFRSNASVIAASNAALVFANQTRTNIGLYGGPETTSGGKALMFYAALRLRVSRLKILGKKDDQYGHIARIKIAKSNVGPPYSVVEIGIKSGVGIMKNMDLIDVAVEVGVLTVNSSGHYYMDEEHLAHGKEAFNELLGQKPELAADIRKRVMEAQ